MLKTRNLKYRYSGGTSFDFPDIEVGEQEEWLLIGPSGSGKTTLLNLIAGFLAPENGTVSIDGTDFTSLSSAARDKFRGRVMGMVFQSSHFIASLTVEQNLLLAQSLSGKKKSKQQARELLQRLGIGDKNKRKPHQLSVGEQQRASIARALVTKPKLILADEPTSALDDQNCDEVVNLLREQAKESSASLLIVTHDNRLKDLVEKRIEL